MAVQDPDGTTIVSHVLERLEKMARHGARLGAIAAIEGGLAAAGLFFGEVHLIAERFQHVGHGQPDFWEKLVDHAGDK